MPQPASLTKEQFYSTFKQHLADGNEEAVSFANEAAERYHGLNRKLTPEEIAALYIEKNPGRISLSDVSADQLKQSLAGLGGSAGAAKPATAPGPPKESTDGGGILKKATAPLLEGQRERIKSGAGQYALTTTPGAAATAVGSAFGKGRETAQFVQGFGRGMGDLGVDLSSPLNVGLAAASLFGGGAMKALGKLPKLARVASMAIKGMHAGFTVEMLADLGTEIPAVKAAMDRKDYRAAGEAAAKAVGEIGLLGSSYRGKGEAKAKPAAGPVEPGPPSRVIARESVEVGGKTKEIRSRDNPKLREEIKKKLGKPEAPKLDQAGVEREIGNLQEALDNPNLPDSEWVAVTNRIEELQKQLPKPPAPPNPLDPAVAAKADTARYLAARAAAAAEKAKIQNTEGYQVPPPPGPPREVIPTTPERRAQRQAEASLRAQNPQIMPPSVGTEGVGQRMAPEETGEFAAQGPPRSRPINPSPAAPAPAKPQGRIPDGTLRPGVGRDFGEFIVKRKMGGVPEGSRISIVETPQGQQVINVIDAQGNRSPAALPFRAAVASLTEKQWIEPAPARKAATPAPAKAVASNVGQPAAPAAPATPRPVASPPPRPAAAKAAPPVAESSTAQLQAQLEALKAERARLTAPGPPTPTAAKAAAPQPTPPEAAPVAKPVEPAATPPPAASLAVPPEMVRGAVQHIIDTQIQPTRAGRTPWARVEVQVTKDFRPVGDPVTLDAQEFTPEAIARLASQHPGADGIKVQSDPPNRAEGSISRRFSSFEPGPPKESAGAAPKPQALTWESLQPEQRTTLAQAALEASADEPTEFSAEDVAMTAENIGKAAKKGGLRQALEDFGFTGEEILALMTKIAGGK